MQYTTRCYITVRKLALEIGPCLENILRLLSRLNLYSDFVSIGEIYIEVYIFWFLMLTLLIHNTQDIEILNIKRNV